MRRIFFKILTCLLLLLFLKPAEPNLCAQQYNNLFFKQFNIADGLPSMSCMNLYKDSYGFLWVANGYGICVYNGSAFTSLSRYDENKNFYLGDLPLNFLQVDSNRLLITCTNGLFIFYYKTKKVERLSITLQKDAAERIEIIGFNNARNKIIIKTGNLIYFFNLLFQQNGLVKCINEKKGVSVRNEFTGPLCFYYTNHSSLASVNTETGKIDSFLYLPNIKGIIINGEAEGKYIITTTENIIQADIITKKIKSLPLPLHPETLFFPRTVKKDLQGNFWIGGESGLFLYNPVINTIKSIEATVSNFSSKKINSGSIADIWVDKESLFIATFSDGLFEYREGLNNFKDYYLPDKLNGVMFSLLLRDSFLLAANDIAGIYKFSLHKKQFAYTYYPVSKDDGSIVQLESINHDNAWVLFHENFKLGIMNLNTMKLITDKLDINNITSNHFHSADNIRLLSRDYRPVIRKITDSFFYITINKSLFSIHGNIKQGFHFTFIDSAKTTASFSCISNSSSGQTFFGTTKGELFIVENNKLIKKTEALNNLFLPVKSIDADSKGNIYVLTVNGFYIYNNKFTLQKEMIKPATGLLDNKIYSGKIDKQDMLWMCTTGGIMAYNTATGQLINFPSAGVMRNSQFITKSMTWNDNNIYFGGTNGITAVNTTHLIPGVINNSLYFDEIINSNKVLHNGLIPGSVLKDKSFAYNNNSFSFSFKSISYQQQAGTYYKYKLEGFDTAWNFIEEGKKINFLSLAPGNYKLLVKEINPGNKEGQQISYAFDIDKPFWKTAGFSIVSAAFIAGFIVLGFNFIVRKKLEEERINTHRQIALKNERERISQDLHDDLGSGLTSIRLLTKSVIAKQEKGNNKEMLENIGKISGELIDQMSEIIWLLNHMDDTVNGLFAHVRRYMNEYLERTKKEIKLDFINDIKEEYHISSMQRRNILLVIKEVFHNVIKHSKATSFSIQCDADAKKIIIIMKDNGTGLPEKKSMNGNGLNNIKKRITAINGTISFRNDNGTEVAIEIPKEIKRL